jgi:hypothetical protein
MTDDYRYSGPRELPLVCSARRCAIDTELGEESYACEAEECEQARLCIGCVWTCNDCSGDFCESHIQDAHAHDDQAGTCYVCLACLAKRRAAAAPRLHPLFEQILKPFTTPPKEAA